LQGHEFPLVADGFFANGQHELRRSDVESLWERRRNLHAKRLGDDLGSGFERVSAAHWDNPASVESVVPIIPSLTGQKASGKAMQVRDPAGTITIAD
jgi:hypothetical protein